MENAYLNTKTAEKVWTKSGKGFRILSGVTVRIIRSLNSLISSIRSFQLHIRSTLWEIGFIPLLHDKNLWVLRKYDGSLVCISVYVDNVLISLVVPFWYLDMLKKVHTLKTDMNLTRYLEIDIL